MSVYIFSSVSDTNGGWAYTVSPTTDNGVTCQWGTVKENKRQPPPLNILAINGGIKFTQGDETYDSSDPNALVGTYWYDPISFGKACLKLNNQQVNYYS